MSIIFVIILIYRLNKHIYYNNISCTNSKSFSNVSKASISSAQLKTKEPNTCMRSPYPARTTFFYLILPFDARTYDFPLCGIFVLAHEQYGIFYTSGDGSAFAPVVRPPTTSVPPHWPTQHHLATAAQ